MGKVVIRPCGEYSEEVCRAAILSALEPLGGLDWVKEGMKIAVKANLITALKPEAAATTHPPCWPPWCACSRRGARR